MRDVNKTLPVPSASPREGANLYRRIPGFLTRLDEHINLVGTRHENYDTLRSKCHSLDEVIRRSPRTRVNSHWESAFTDVFNTFVERTRRHILGLLRQTAALERRVADLEKEVAALEAQAQERKVTALARPRAVVGKAGNNAINAGPAALFLTAKLLKLKGEGVLADYKPGRGRNSPDPNAWIEATLKKLGVSVLERRLAMADPAVWYKVDRDLYRVKAMRKFRANQGRAKEQKSLSEVADSTKQAGIAGEPRKSGG